MNIIEQSKAHCRNKPKTILFSDALDERVLKAARYLVDNKLGRPVLCGKPFEIRELAAEHGFSSKGLKIQAPLHDPDFNTMAKEVGAALGNPKLTPFEAENYLKDRLWYSMMALNKNKVDMVIAGNMADASEILHPALNIIGTSGEGATVSGFFLLNAPNSEETIAFADCTVVPNPTARQLADIAINTAFKYQAITKRQAKIAMLSFSTQGSARHESTKKIIAATQLVKEREPGLIVEGELQFDAAAVPGVASQKIENSILKGQANVYVFPSLNAANIGYKIAERVAGYSAIGAFLQGLSKPVHVLSRGCSSDTIINLALVASALN